MAYVRRVALAAMLLPAIAAAQGGGGTWKPLRASFDVYPNDVPRAAYPAIRAQFEKIIAVFRATPALSAGMPLHIAPELSGDASLAAARGGPYPAQMVMYLHADTVNAAGRARRANRNAIYVVANDVSALCGVQCDDWFTEPAVMDSVGGFPRIEHRVYVTRAGAPPMWVAVTMEQALAKRVRELRLQLDTMVRDSARTARGEVTDSAIRGWQEVRKGVLEGLEAQRRGGVPPDSIAKQRREFDTVCDSAIRDLRAHRGAEPPELRTLREETQARLGRVQARLAAMSPDDRRAGATLCDQIDEDAMVCGPTPDGRKLVRINENFYDRTRPKSEFQVLVLYWFSGTDRDTPAGRMLYGAWGALDWKALQTLLR